MTCVHDTWYRTDRLWLAILVAIITSIAVTQAYRAGERAVRKTAYDAGWDACQEQF